MNQIPFDTRFKLMTYVRGYCLECQRIVQAAQHFPSYLFVFFSIGITNSEKFDKNAQQIFVDDV